MFLPISLQLKMKTILTIKYPMNIYWVFFFFSVKILVQILCFKCRDREGQRSRMGSMPWGLTSTLYVAKPYSMLQYLWRVAYLLKLIGVTIKLLFTYFPLYFKNETGTGWKPHKYHSCQFRGPFFAPNSYLMHLNSEIEKNKQKLLQPSV